jgi:hypothetical protein
VVFSADFSPAPGALRLRWEVPVRLYLVQMSRARASNFGQLIKHRLRQGIRALLPRPGLDRSSLPPYLLTPAQADAFLALSPADQAHLLRVYGRLRDQAVTDRDLLVAALLHDIGKVTPNGRVRLIDRVALVLLRPVAVRFASLPAPAWRRGLAIAVHHAELGAARAAALGCSERTCWLIRHHHDDVVFDQDLRLLQAADRVD